jgi:hypothetical protein
MFRPQRHALAGERAIHYRVLVMMLAWNVARYSAYGERAPFSRIPAGNEFREIDRALDHGSGAMRKPAEQWRRVYDVDRRSMQRFKSCQRLVEAIGLVGVVDQDRPPWKRELKPVADPV